MKQFQVALQLYSVRQDMEKDVAATLKKVKEIGYDFVEFAGFYGIPGDKIRALLDENGLICASIHQTYDVFLSDPVSTVAYLKAIGTKYSAIPWMGREKHVGTAAFDQTVREITGVGKLLKEAGIQLLYHNHDFEFETLEGKFLLDWLYQSFPADILQTEVDTCWVRYAGYDPVAYLLKYKGRSPVVHLKDFTCTGDKLGPVYALIDSAGNTNKPVSREAVDFSFKPIGYGIQDIPGILTAAEIAGADIVVVEQDESLDCPAMESARLSRAYLKTLGQ